MTQAEIREWARYALDRIDADDYCADWGRYDSVGIRSQYEPFGPEGTQITHTSHVWDDNNDTGEDLDGLCVTGLQACADGHHRGYPDAHIAIIGSTAQADYGEDYGELILRYDYNTRSYPTVLKVLA